MDAVDSYLAALAEPKQSTLRALRQTILEIIPEAEPCISYGIPAFRLQGKVIAGFAAYKNHLSYFPHSGSVLTERNLSRPLRQPIGITSVDRRSWQGC